MSSWWLLIEIKHIKCIYCVPYTHTPPHSSACWQNQSTTTLWTPQAGQMEPHSAHMRCLTCLWVNGLGEKGREGRGGRGREGKKKERTSSGGKETITTDAKSRQASAPRSLQVFPSKANDSLPLNLAHCYHVHSKNKAISSFAWDPGISASALSSLHCQSPKAWDTLTAH